MFIIGSINGCPYMIAMASAQRIARQFEHGSLLGVVTGVNTASSVIGRFMNTWLTSCALSYEWRVFINCLMMAIGLVGCGFSTNFWVTLPCVFCMGFTSGFGGSIMLSYLPFRRKNLLLKQVASGTGMSGIIGAGYSFMCIYVDVSFFWSFIGVSPLILVYALLFYFVVRKSPEEDPEPSVESVSPGVNINEDNNEPLLSTSNDENNALYTCDKQSLAPKYEKVSFCERKLFQLTWYLVLCCGSVYFFEFVIQSCFVDCGVQDHVKYNWLYSLCNLVYQTGIFIGRSTLPLGKFPYVGFLSWCQMAMFVVWITQPFYYWMPVWFMIASMVVVGIIGGLSFVNVFDQMLRMEGLDARRKEMATAWMNVFISFFTVLSSVFTLVAEQTFFKGKSR